VSATDHRLTSPDVPAPPTSAPGPRPEVVRPRSLAEVARRLGVAAPADSASVTGVALASDRVRPGDLFAALPGARAHGADHAAAAVARGAVAVLTDAAGASRLGDPGVAVLVVGDPRGRLGALASWIYGDPSGLVDVLAVTGTSGKTSVTYLLEAGLAGAGRAAGVIGTTGTRIGGQPVATALTTPEAPDLHALLAVMAERGVRDAAVEVSSHALVLGRVDALRARVALFTNLGRDHLDFHPGMAGYLDAKALLFTPEHTASAVVCLDGGLPPDHRAGVEIARRAVAAGVDVHTLGVRAGSTADWQVEDVRATGGDRGSRFVLRGPDGVRHEVALPLPGAFQVANAALAIAGLVVAGFDPDDVIDGIGRCSGVPGRLERVEAGQRFLALVDYAHKPPALETVLTAVRPAPGGRLIVVVGAGGDRDRGKRPLMGEVAARLADVVVVTDDNPRSEDPAAIRAEMLAGAGGGPADVAEVGDRRLAIREAVRRAGDRDVVIVAGKGHESGQERDGVVTPFDDRVVLAEEIAAAARPVDVTTVMSP
jgi:UDP-N-acetylmuramoyl-L-alanyl-D-glutamate--2,6-diaminopimelate ligase